MEYLLGSAQMKNIDAFSILEVGIPSVVLMERAALEVAKHIISLGNKGKVLILCGRGNNGADGLALARILHQKGYEVSVDIPDASKTGTCEFEIQKKIIFNLGIVQCNDNYESSYDYIVDAYFGIGLSRNIEGAYKEKIDNINSLAKKCAARVISVDIPSGINATTGQIMNVAIRADETVTFGYNKIGMTLYPGKEYAGNVIVKDIGFADYDLSKRKYTDNVVKYVTDEDIDKIPMRSEYTDKGKCGKVFIIAGSENMAGAACMSTEATLRTGAGLVKVYSHKENRNIILSKIPEAIVDTYKDAISENYLKESLDWAECVIIGPGLSMENISRNIISKVITYINQNENVDKLFIIDADGLNIIAEMSKNGENISFNENVIFTPHIGEASRLLGKEIKYIKENLIEAAIEISQKYNVVCVLKDATTVISNKEDVYVNLSGNCGMSTAGSGDVLTGVIAGSAFLMRECESCKKAAFGVYIHGRAGDYAKIKKGVYGMKSWDIAQEVPYVIGKKDIEKT